MPGVDADTSMKSSSATRVRPAPGPIPAARSADAPALPDAVPAQTVNKACASGMEAIAHGARVIAAGEADIVVAGGIESMSRMPYLIDAADARWGHKMGGFELVDAMYRDGFRCSLCDLLMGETAELLAREYGISREASDEFSLASQQKARAPSAEGAFDARWLLSTSPGPKGPATLAADEHPRADTTLAGSGAAGADLHRRRHARHHHARDRRQASPTAARPSCSPASAPYTAHGLQPLARVTGWASAGVDPRRMGIGPVPAVQKLLAQQQLTLDAFDLVELNEAFAPQVLAVLRDLPIPESQLNVHGGAIALGHPIGCTGTRIVVTLVHALRRHGLRAAWRRCASAAAWAWRWRWNVRLVGPGSKVRGTRVQGRGVRTVLEFGQHRARLLLELGVLGRPVGVDGQRLDFAGAARWRRPCAPCPPASRRGSSARRCSAGDR